MGYGIKSGIISCLCVIAAFVSGTALAQTLQHRYYVLNPKAESQAMDVISLSDNNTISVESTSLQLDRYEVGTFGADAGIALGAEIKGSGAFVVGSSQNLTDLSVPAWFQGTLFVVPHIRKSHVLSLLSVGHDAQVRIERGDVSETISLLKGVVNQYDAGEDNSISSIIHSDAPILVMHIGNKNNAAWGDVYPVPPASNELWGVRSQKALIGAAENSTSLTVYASGGASQSYTLDQGGRLRLEIGANTSQGRGDGIHIIADKPISAVQYGDSDGSDATAFWPRAYMGTSYGLPVDTQYLSVVCPESATQITLYEDGASPQTQTCDGDSNSYPGKAYFGAAEDGTHLKQGAYLQSTKPIYVYHEASASNDEHQLAGHKNAYYILDAWLQEGDLSLISLENNNEISSGSTHLTLDEYELGIIPAGADLAPGREIIGSGPFDLGNAVDGSDIPVPSTFAGLSFAVPHINGEHIYDLLSPTGEAEVRISLDGVIDTLSLQPGEVVAYPAGNSNAIAGLIQSSRPILVYHRSREDDGSGLRFDTYPVAPLATELWGVRSGDIIISAFEDATDISVYDESGQAQNVLIDAGETFTVSIGDSQAQGAGSVLHIVADKPVSGVRLSDGDGNQATSLWPAEYRANKYGIPVATQYIAAICIQADTKIMLVHADNRKQLQTCSSNGGFPAKAYFGAVSNGENIAAGAYVESDKPIFLYYEGSSTDDEKSLLGSVVKPSLPPSAQISVDTSQGVAPLTVQFDAGNSSDNGGSPILDYQWEFGNGSSGSGPAVSYTYTQTGSYTVLLNITNQQGDRDLALQPILVDSSGNSGPSAAFTITPSSGVAPVSVTFDASGSNDSDGNIIAYTWDFGDGNASAGQAVSHTYLAAGSYTVTLTVSDDDGADDTKSASISVIAANTAPHVDAGPDMSLELPAGAQLNGEISDDGLPNPPQAITSSWSQLSGPGSVVFADTSLPDSDVSFSAEGDYVLRLSASDGSLNSHDDVQITVTAAATEVVFETGVINGVTDAWQTIQTEHQYGSMVVIASVVLPGQNAVPAVTRVRNAVGNSFEIRLQNPGNQPISGYQVFYFVVEEGVYNTAEHGIRMEAIRALSMQTADKTNWSALEPRPYQNSYSNPVVLGQVMSENDSEWSVFWASSSNNRNTPPTTAGYSAGKHVAQDPNITRSDETLGILVLESGISSMAGVNVYAALTADSIRGTGNSATANTVPVTGLEDPQAAILSSAAMDGADGGWPVLFGEVPISATQITLAIDEDTIVDSERKHTSEQLALLVFDASSVPVPTLELTKTIMANNSYDTVGQAIQYEYALINTGDIRLGAPFVVEDDHITTQAIDCEAITMVGNLDAYLDTGEVLTCSASYPVSQADLDAGSITNVARASARGADDSRVESPEASAIATAVQSAALVLEKTAVLDMQVLPPADITNAGDRIDYHFSVQNSGNVSLGQISITDPLLDPDNIACELPMPLSLVPGEMVLCNGARFVTQSDIDTGAVSNSAMANALQPSGASLTDLSDDPGNPVGSDDPTITDIPQSAGIALGAVIASGNPFNTAGDVLMYEYQLQNTGNLTLSNIMLKDMIIDGVGVGVNCPQDTLIPAEAMACFSSYAVSLENIQAGSRSNHVEVTALAANGSMVSSIDSSIALANERSELNLDTQIISGAPFFAPGDVLEYRYVLSNTGNTILTAPFTVTDDKVNAANINCPENTAGAGNGDENLDPGESVECLAIYIINATDMSAGRVLNTASATAFDHSSASVISNIDSEQADVTKVQTPTIITPGVNTSSNPFLLRGLAPSQSEVQLYVNDVYQQSTLSNDAGAWQFGTYLRDGQNTLKVKAREGESESGFSQEISVIYSNPLSRDLGSLLIDDVMVLTPGTPPAPYFATTGNIIIQDTGKLVMMPGTTIEFSGSGRSLRVHGSLLIDGTEKNPVRLTSGVENPSQSAQGEWNGVQINSEAKSVKINHALIEYAGRGVEFMNASGLVQNSVLQENGAAIYFYQNNGENSISLEGLRIENNTTGVFLENTGYGAQLTDSIIENNSTGVSIRGDSSPLIKLNSISDNGEHGIYIKGPNSSSTSPYPHPLIAENDIVNNGGVRDNIYMGYFYGLPRFNEINAQGNWWGSPDLSVIKSSIYDHGYNASAPYIDYSGFRSSSIFDADGDGVLNDIDLDDDNDGVLDINDALPFDPTESADSDGDGSGDNADAFPDDPEETTDTDNDGIGNHADTDDDNDTVSDVDDAFPQDPGEWADFDKDGIGDNTDTDDDGDGYSDQEENIAGSDPLNPGSTPDPVIDATPPQITIIGDNPAYTPLYTEIKDAGAIAIDNVDGPVLVEMTTNADKFAIGSYITTYTATDSANNTATAIRVVEVINEDTTKPEIHLTGTNPVWLRLGDTYQEHGANAYSGSASSTAGAAIPVSISGSVNNSLEGAYAIHYSAADNDGNTASMTRTVVVFDASSIHPYESSSLPRTGNRTVFVAFDDAYANAGVAREFVRDDAGEFVSDLRTGVRWQDNSASDAQTLNWEDAKTYCQRLSLGGIDDWRLPSRGQLVYLMDHSRSSLENEAYIPREFVNASLDNPQGSYSYWTSSGAGSDKVWGVDFKYGELRAHDAGEDDLKGVRCVSGTDAAYTPWFLHYQNVAVDIRNGLMWQDDTDVISNRLRWPNALHYCENLELDGSTDWRLPNINEAYTLIDELRKEASSSAFLNRQETFSEFWWTSSAFMRESSLGIRVLLASASSSITRYDQRTTYSSSLKYVRCTRDFSYPEADAGDDQLIVSGAPVTLDASSSTGPDGGFITDYHWSVHESGEVLSTEKSFSKSDFAPGEHELILTITDNNGLKSTDEVRVIIEAANQSPVANAGRNQTRFEQDPVEFDGAASTDSDGNIVAYEWHEGATLLSQDQRFTKSDFSKGEHFITLSVTDDQGAVSSDIVVITILEYPNTPPVAQAGQDLTALENTPVTLDGSASSDSDGTIQAYEWSEGAVVLSQNQSFTKNDFSIGEHIISLVVADDRGASSSDSVVITIEEDPNILPVADAGQDQTVAEHSSLTLDGSASSDSDGMIVSHEWKEGFLVLSHDQSFTTNDFLIGEHVITLTVTDDKGASASDVTLITIVGKANIPPIAYAGEDQQASAGETITLAAYGQDEDGTIDEYVWLQTDGPTVTLSTGSEQLSSFIMPDLSIGQSLEFQVSVTDNDGDTALDTVAVNRLKEVSLSASTYSGIAPLEVSFIVDTNYAEAINNFGMDYDGEGSGDGAIDETSTDPDVFAHTYEQVGIYSPYVFMLDEQGNDYFDQITIEVVSGEDTEAQIKAQWDAMVLELMNGNVEAALVYFEEESRDEYRWLFNDMDSSKINAIFSGVNDLVLDSLNDGIAQCSAIRNETDGSYAYPVQLAKSASGVWKLYGL